MDTSQNEDSEKQQKVKKSFKESYGSLRSYPLHLLDIRSDTDRDSTMEAILKDIPFRGHNAWILIFSIIVASMKYKPTLFMKCIFSYQKI